MAEKGDDTLILQNIKNLRRAAIGLSKDRGDRVTKYVDQIGISILNQKIKQSGKNPEAIDRIVGQAQEILSPDVATQFKNRVLPGGVSEVQRKTYNKETGQNLNAVDFKKLMTEENETTQVVRSLVNDFRFRSGSIKVRNRMGLERLWLLRTLNGEPPFKSPQEVAFHLNAGTITRKEANAIFIKYFGGTN